MCCIWGASDTERDSQGRTVACAWPDEHRVHRLKQLLWPDWRRMALFAIFLAITIGGLIQAWTFTDVAPKPLLYDLLRPFRIWPLWMLLLVPLALLSLPLRLVGLDLMGGSYWLSMAASVAYFYVLSCLVVAGFDCIKARWKAARSQPKA